MFHVLNDFVMNILTRRKDWKDRLCDASRTSIDIPVKDGLALTPARVRQLTEKGIAVSLPSSNNEGIFDSSDNPADYSLDSMYERSMTREELWERSQVAKQNIMNARNRKKEVENKKE